MGDSTLARSGQLRAISSIQVLLKRCGELAKVKTASAESKIIFYYGVRSIPRPWSLIKGELDKLFGFPVVERIEQATDYFRSNCMTISKRGKFGTIYTDPPWSFRNWSAKGTGRNAISHYDCVDFASLAALPVADLAADDYALFLWATDPL